MDRQTPRRWLSAWWLLLGGLFGVLLAGCDSALAAVPVPPTATAAPPAYQGTIVCAGSGVLAPLIGRAAAQFRQLEPNAFVFVITSTSQLGLATLQDDGADLGLSEVAATDLQGVDAGQLVENRIAGVPYAVIVHPSTGISNLTPAQLAQIYTGQVTNWREVGGADQEITTFQPAKGLGMRYLFFKNYLAPAGADDSPVATITSNAVADVGRRPGAIGYAPLAMVTDAVRVVAVDGVLPGTASVTAGRYPFWSYARLYTKGPPGGLARVFLNYLLSPNVQKDLVGGLGYTPLALLKDQPQP